MSYVGSCPCESTTVSSAGSGRSPRPGPPTPGGCWSKPAGSTAPGRTWQGAHRRQDGQPPEASRSRGRRSSDCTAPGPASKPAGSDARSSRSRPPESSPGSCGRSPKPSEPEARQQRHPVGWVGGGPARAGNPRLTMSNPPPGRPRSILDSGSPRRTMVLRSQPAYISLTARRAQQAGPPPPQPTTTPRTTNANARNQRPPVDNGSPYQFGDGRSARRPRARSGHRDRRPVVDGIERWSAPGCAPGAMRVLVGVQLTGAVPPPVEELAGAA